MWLDLSKIIEIPDASAPFETELDAERLIAGSILGFAGAPTAEGTVTNTAGALTLNGTLRAVMHCRCDRCGREFDREKVLKLSIPLAADVETDDPESDVIALEGDGIDVSDLLETSFILNEETKLLCKPDCKGLCPQCGKDLNDGSCGCTKKPDPRLAVLGQLLDK